ncbi:MAG: hypothetical protein H8D56_17535 [Planctomycetes bacterium]|nr:hypothetical protein [Planctomycetota bacterium]MBL7146919.1 hypothetical protein [Phycisphaerae bacterium]
MKNKIMLMILSLMMICGIAPVLTAGPSVKDDAILRQTFNLGCERSQQIQYFMMESKLLTYALDGKRVSTDVFRLRLKCVPAKTAGTKGDQWTCTRFTVQLGDEPEVEVPAIKNWTYVFKVPPTGIDDKGQTLGIDHAQFANLVDASGKALAPDKSYHVYNAFIDFHGFCDIFAERIEGGKSVQDLKRIGQRIVHAAANTEAPVNLGSSIAEGSTFKNGQVTMELKGLSRVARAACAMVGFDSGESSFKMFVKPAPDMEMRVVGSSHYKGDIYIDLLTNWVKKVTMYELVVSEVTLPMPPNKVNSVIERDIVVRNVSADEFERR